MTARRRSLSWVLILTLVLLGVSGYWLVRSMTSPVAPSAAEPASVTMLEIPAGASFKQVAALLQQHHLIANRWGFLLLGKLFSAERKVHPGEYALHPGMRPVEILYALTSGRVVLHPVTIPEGYSIAQIADELVEKGLVDRKEFIALARDAAFIKTLGLDVPSLEGYLFPNTYQFPKHATARDILTVMVAESNRVWTPELRSRAKDINMSVHEVLTLASVIEKETGVDAERELVAGVFHNRLRKRIPLQSDPTVIYGMRDFDGNLRKRDLTSDTPYNTYRHAGLPPGPIANPGEQSIRAALYPVPSTYLYFVSRNDGTHQFSSTLHEHNEAVDKYQRRQVRRAS